MIPSGATIYEAVISLLGPYIPTVYDGETYINFGYLAAAGMLLIACWFCFRGFLMLLKGVLGKYA